MGKASRDKGKRGEHEVAELLRDHGIPARRGVQYAGGTHRPQDARIAKGDLEVDVGGHDVSPLADRVAGFVGPNARIRAMKSAASMITAHGLPLGRCQTVAMSPGLGAHERDDLAGVGQHALPDLGRERHLACLAGGPIQRLPGAAHAVGVDADVTLVVTGDGLVEPILLLVELRAQQIRDQQPEPADAPLALHGDGDLVEALDHRLDTIG